MMVYQLEGDSADTDAAESLKAGDWVFVDTSIREPQDSKLYVLKQYGNGYLLKRARLINKGWGFLSNNTSYPAMLPEQAEIVGQVFDAVGSKNIR